MKKTIFLYIDAFRYDYLKYTPFLNGLAEQRLRGNLRVEPMHQFEFTIFSGVSPKSHKFWAWYCFNPEQSPYRWIWPWVWILKAIDNKYLRDLFSYGTALLMYLRGKTRFVKIGAIPWQRARFFSAISDKSFIDRSPMEWPMLFDILRQNNFSFVALEWPLVGKSQGVSLRPWLKKEKNIFDYFERELKKNDFVFAHFVRLDTLMHRYGLENEKVIDYLCRLDREINEFIGLIKREYPEINIIVSSDHGMVEIKEKIDILKEISGKGLQEGKDFVVFLDATMARFWAKEDKRQELKDILLKIPNGRLYSSDNFKDLGIYYDREVAGDLLFLADSGVLISPNYLDGSKEVKAMHGYKPEGNELDGIFLVNGQAVSKKEIKDIQLIDILPTILSLLKLPIPGYCRGRNLLYE